MRELDPKVIDELERSKNEVLRRVAQKLREQEKRCEVHAAGHYSTTTGHRSGSSHNSHSSGPH